MKIKRTIVFGAVLIGLTAFAMSVKTSTPKPTEHVKPTAVETMPDFAVKDANGKTINLRSLKGKKVFVNLWATWCGPCRREMPSINNLYKKVNSKTEFVMLSLDDNFNKAIAYKAQQGFDFPVYYPANNLPPLFQVQGIPATFIFNEKGELIQRLEGMMEYDTEQFVKLLSGK